MYTKDSTTKIIQDILNEHKLVINISSEGGNHEVCYNKQTNTIIFRQFLLLNLYNKFSEIKPIDVLMVAVYHEIGHYLYYQRHSIEHGRKEKEIYAWKYGENLVPEELLKTYQIIKANYKTH